jgi:hemoglobin
MLRRSRQLFRSSRRQPERTVAAMSFSENVQSARTLLSPGYPAGVTEEMIHGLVHAFYGKVRVDAELGPVFNRSIKDWTPHLAKMCDFWSSVTLMSGRYHGTPMQAHAALPDITPQLFVRWLQLFEETAAEVCPPKAAALFIDRAGRIAESLQMGIAVSRGELPPHYTRQRT